MTMKTDRYKVSQELMDEIDGWNNTVDRAIWGYDLDKKLPIEVQRWWMDEPGTTTERNNRLIAVIRYVNGEDVFEVEKPKKWIVRSKKRTWDDDYKVVVLYSENDGIIFTNLKRAPTVKIVSGFGNAFKFDTKEEAEQFVNPLMEVVEAEDD